MEIQNLAYIFRRCAWHSLAAQRWRLVIQTMAPKYYVGQFRYGRLSSDCDPPNMDIAAAKAAGAKLVVVSQTMVALSKMDFCAD